MDTENRDADFGQDTGDNGNEREASQSEQDQIRGELQETKDKYLRLLAEFDNFKKRTLKERADLLKYQGERIFTDLLDVIDNFELAVQHSDADPEKVRSGVQLIHKMFQDVLTKWEVKGESAVGKAFDPQKHSAISRLPSTTAEPGTVTEELKKAYFYKDKLLRPGEVVVAAENVGAESENENAH